MLQCISWQIQQYVPRRTVGTRHRCLLNTLTSTDDRCYKSRKVYSLSNRSHVREKPGFLQLRLNQMQNPWGRREETSSPIHITVVELTYPPRPLPCPFWLPLPPFYLHPSGCFACAAFSEPPLLVIICTISHSFSFQHPVRKGEVAKDC